MPYVKGMSYQVAPFSFSRRCGIVISLGANHERTIQMVDFTETAGQHPSTTRSMINEVAGLVAGGLSLDEACELVGIDQSEATPLPARPAFMPTPDQIAAECERIKEGWSEADKRRRDMFDPADSLTANEFSTLKLWQCGY